MTALQGFRLIQLQSRPPAETATYMLAGMGMDVIRVDEPVPPPTAMGAASPDTIARAEAWNIIGRNKRSMVLDLRTELGKEAFYRLVKTADAVLEAYRPGVTQRLGIDYETLRGINPSLVYCSLTGFGQTGPYSQLPTHEDEVMAIGGATFQNVDGDGNPIVHSLYYADANAGVHAALAIVSALLSRTSTGTGQYIDVAMSETLHTFQLLTWSRFLESGVYKRSPPFDLGCFRCGDGRYLSANNTEARLWTTFVNAIGLPELETAKMSEPSWPDTVRKIQERLLTKSASEWFKIIVDSGGSAAPVLTLGEAIDDPQFRERGMLLELTHPVVGPVQQLNFPVRFSETPAEFSSFAPMRGEHNDSLLAELGFSEEERATIANR